MYVDKKKSHAFLIDLIVALLITVLCIVPGTVKNSKEDMAEESALALKQAVWRSAVQCYAVEGAYPPGLAYLEENYGLQINREDFYVVYDAFAPNMPPDIRVVARYADDD